jgi:glycine betaine/choline ABC-type transport system substrate-binding protein
MIRNLLFSVLLGLLLSGGQTVPPAYACAGHTLSIGFDGSRQQEIVTHIVAELIRQRTGTKVHLLRFASQQEMLADAEPQCLDLLIVTFSQHFAEDSGPFAEGKLVRLEPFGYQDASVFPALQRAAQKKFPALQRLVNRLAGLIDESALRGVEQELAAGHDLREVAKKFLIEQNLIYGS